MQCLVLDFHPLNTQLMISLPNNTAVVNETFSVTCTAEANPPAEYMLFKDGVYLSSLTTNQSVLMTSVTEKISQVHYKCVPFNHFGRGPEKEITIALHCKYCNHMSCSTTTTTTTTTTTSMFSNNNNSSNNNNNCSGRFSGGERAARN